MKDYFNFASLTAFLLSATMIFFIIKTLKSNNLKWEKAIFLSFLLGLVICIVVAFRDHYGIKSGALIPMNSIISTILSILGISLIISTITSLFIKNPKYHRFVFVIISFTFLVKFIVVEAYRIISIL